MTVATARREIDLEDLSGLPAAIAIDRLRACELRPAIEPVDVEDPADHAHVHDHAPHANTTVRRGQLIRLLIGQASRPPDPELTASASRPDTTNKLEDVQVVPAASETGASPHLDRTAGPPESAYWALRSPVEVDHLVWANRRVAHALGADLASTDPARVLRPPGSMSFKRQPPIPVSAWGWKEAELRLRRPRRAARLGLVLLWVLVTTVSSMHKVRLVVP